MKKTAGPGQEKTVEKSDEIKDDKSKEKQEEEIRKLKPAKYRKIFAVRILGKASSKEAIDALAFLLDSDDLELIRERKNQLIMQVKLKLAILPELISR